ncbi:hypothetical protein ACPYO6_15220 [Georgenia sp. Z1344]|uniref:hypothetical protein n=1 Tax=Georgenia sp. Z1344 TaxID=3416706 RepID=UPI003CF62C76
MTSPAPTPPGPQPITRGAIVDNAPVLLLITVGVSLVGAFAGFAAGGGTTAWTIGGFGIGLVLMVGILWLTLRPYVRVDADLGAATIAAKGRTVPLAEIDQLHIGPASFGTFGKPGVHMAFGRGTDVVAPVYLRGAPLRRLPGPQAQLLAEAIHRTSAAPAADAVEALVVSGMIERPAWHEVPDPDRPEGMVRYLLVGPLTGRPDPAGLARVAANLSLPVEALSATIGGSVRASREVARALARAGIQVERLQGPADDAASGGAGTSDGPGVDAAVLAERARAVTVLTEGPRDLTGITGEDSTAAVFEYVRLVNPAGARQMLEQLASARPAARDKQLDSDAGLRKVWARYGHEVSAT